jgi:ABC-type nitrate/sulfonate/bicarbonate transport system permease component
MVDVPIESTERQSAERAPVRFRGGGFEPVSRQWAAWLFFVLVLLGWEMASRHRLIDPLFLPPPSQIWTALQDMVLSGELFRHLAASLVRIGFGWLIGSAAGVLLGGLIGLSSLGRSIGLPFISALFPVPKIALLPLLILWLGIGEASKVATIALGVFFPMAVSTYAGVDAVPRNLIRMAQSFNLPFRSIISNVVVPAMLPSVLSGCRISASIALILVVSAEMIGANTGIGALLLTTGNLMQTDQLMAALVAIAVLGLLIGALISWLERVLLAWR